MKKYVSAFVALTVLVTCLFGRSAFAGNVTLVKSDPQSIYKLTSESVPPQPAMFVIRGDKAVVYLFGSMHMIDPDLKWRTPLFDHVVAKSDVIWLESTTLEMANPTLQLDNLRSAYNDQRGLTEILSKDEYARADKAAKSQGIDLLEYNNLHPWVVSDILQGARYKKDIKQDASKEIKVRPGVEMIIEAMAMGKPIKALENTKKHVLLFSGLSAEDEKALLMNTVDEIEQSRRDDIDAIKTAWQSGDLEVMDRLGNVSMEKNTPGLFKSMIVKRNREMADGIINQLKGNQTNFVAVGAMHLAGSHSVVSLLEQEGYRVERLYSPEPPIASTTYRKQTMPNYRVANEIPPYLNVSLRKDTDTNSGKVLIRLAYPRVINGCAEVSPIIYKVQPDEDGFTIKTGGFLLNIHPWEQSKSCGSSNKLIMVDIPMDIADLKAAKTRAVRFAFPGGQDNYDLGYENGEISLNPKGEPSYYRPDQKKLTVSGL